MVFIHLTLFSVQLLVRQISCLATVLQNLFCVVDPPRERWRQRQDDHLSMARRSTAYVTDRPIYHHRYNGQRPVLRVRLHIIRNERIENVGISQSSMVSKLRIICKLTVAGHHHCTTLNLPVTHPHQKNAMLDHEKVVQKLPFLDPRQQAIGTIAFVNTCGHERTAINTHGEAGSRGHA